MTWEGRAEGLTAGVISQRSGRHPVSRKRTFLAVGYMLAVFLLLAVNHIRQERLNQHLARL